LSLFVVDASVAVLWAVPSASSQLTDPSLRLLRHYVEREAEFVVPDLFWAEVSNALCKGVRQRRWSRENAEVGVAELTKYNFDTVPTFFLLPEALSIALNFSLSLYDCVYVALASQAQANLVTADERVANALAARFPVKWLGVIDALL
jgi:predicted nucleic acid-binding protein